MKKLLFVAVLLGSMSVVAEKAEACVFQVDDVQHVEFNKGVDFTISEIKMTPLVATEVISEVHDVILIDDQSVVNYTSVQTPVSTFKSSSMTRRGPPGNMTT